METSVQKLEKSEVKLTVALTEEEMKKFRVKAVKDLQDKVKVPGFRAGKIPEDVLRGEIGEQAFLGEVMEFAVSESYEEAVKKENLHPVGYPKMNIIQQDPLKYEAIVPTVPEIKFKKEIEKGKVSRKKPEVKEEEIQAVLADFMKRTVEWKDVVREAKTGDRVEIDFDGKDADGVPLDGTSSKNHPIVLGSKSFIPGFEEEIVGMKMADEKDFEITFPKDYHSAAFKNKKVKFHVKLNRIEEGTESELNDAFAQKVSKDEKKTLADLKQEIHTELGHQKEHDEDTRIEGEFLKELLEIVEAEVPEVLVDREVDFLIERIKGDLEKRKQKWEDYEAEMKEKGKDIRAELRKPALEQVLIRLGLERLFELENPEVSEADIEEEIEHLVGHYPPEFQVMLKGRYVEGSQEREMVKSGVRLKKVVKAHTTH